ncbi:NADH-quinone oxidoreductase subunit C [candidate division FCPU426 bacterium]|nr:NADH-quinone oxidoreductase subunit C [candidate division FCPU426 bacterium]
MIANKLSPEQIIEKFKAMLGKAVLAGEIIRRAEGRKQAANVQIWLTLDKAALKAAVRLLCSLHYPHLAVISGYDAGEAVVLVYHFYIYYGEWRGEYNVSLRISLAKTDLSVDTISDLIPGAVVSEREKQEFLGVRVKDIPDARRIFLPEDFPEGVFPWRQDETGIPESMVKKLYEAGKNEGEKRRAASVDSKSTRQE